MNEENYNYLRLGIKDLHNVNVSLSFALEDCIKDFEVTEDLEVQKSNYLSFMLEVQDQMVLLIEATARLDKLNEDLVLNGDADTKMVKPKSDEFEIKLLKGFED